MGFEISYQAIPADAGLIDRAIRDADYAGWLDSVPFWLRTGNGPGPRAEDATAALWQDLTELVRRHPGFESRNCYLDRWWDKLHYLLSANRRGAAGSATDGLMDMAIKGGRLISDHARAPQGCPVRYTSPAEAAEIAQVLRPMRVEQLRPHYSPADMEAAGVYKFFAGRDEREWEYLPDFFAAFRQFYLNVAEHDEGVIVCLD